MACPDDAAASGLLALSVGLVGGSIGCICRLIVGPLPVAHTLVLSWGMAAAFFAATLGGYLSEGRYVCLPAIRAAAGAAR